MYLHDMRAVVRDEGGVTLAWVAAPEPAADEVVIDVAFAGVCRSDLAVASGRVAVARGRVLGHELAGRVRMLGAEVGGLATGDPVTVIPFVACGACAACAASGHCARPRWLGVDLDGGFADQVRVPASSVVRLPPGLSLLAGAYVEPVAAALGALAVVERGARVLICGDGRIAALSARVLEAHGARVTRGSARELPAGAFDVVIEHAGATPALLAALRPGGTLILKSRAHDLVAFDAGELVARDLVVRGISHGSFLAAVDWLATRRIAIEDLLAPPRPLEAFAAVFATARAGEQQKQMFAIAPARERAQERM
jgi:L-iditol 2-dehydrogenase